MRCRQAPADLGTLRLCRQCTGDDRRALLARVGRSALSPDSIAAAALFHSQHTQESQEWPIKFLSDPHALITFWKALETVWDHVIKECPKTHTLWLSRFLACRSPLAGATADAVEILRPLEAHCRGLQAQVRLLLAAGTRAEAAPGVTRATGATSYVALSFADLGDHGIQPSTV